MRSIFWKIFLIVWLTCTLVVMISTGLLYMKLVENSYQKNWQEVFKPKVQGIVATHERFSKFFGGSDRTRQLPFDYSLNIIILAVENGQLIYGNPAELGASDWKFFSYTSRRGKKYQVKIPPLDLNIFEGAIHFWQDVSIYRLWLTILVSALFSLLLALLINRPIKRLRSHIYIMGGGELDTRLDRKLTRRRDEFGSLARSFNYMAEHIQSLVDSKQQLLHDVSHELRAPLARLQVAGELARCQAKEAGIDSDMYDRIDRECGVLNKLIDEILTLSRMEAGVSEIEEQSSVEVSKLIEKMVADARFLHNDRDITLSVSGRPKKVLLVVAALEKAFKNVLENAIKYSTNAVQATVQFGRREVVISVADRGPGMAEKELNKIFTPFYRAQAYNSREGYGLGMSITLKCVKQLGGEIHAENRKGGGLKVSISLPL